MLFPEGKLIIFTKAPVAGESKTRLIPALGKQGAAKLQRRMSHHVIGMAMQAELAEVELQCFPDSSHEFFLELLDKQCIELNRQQGKNLGERMANAIRNALSQHRYAIVIGTDAPVIDADYLKAAFQQLAQGTGVVLGPAEDGGYVLIGLSTFEPRLFENIDWGTEQVLQQTLDRIKQTGLSLYQMPVQWDVDNPEDLLKIQKTQKLTYLLQDMVD